MYKLDRQRARELIPDIVDGEVPSNIHRAFFERMRHDPELQREYRSHFQVKMTICCRCRRVVAPPHLREKIDRWLNES
ncbi:MAG: hypothetical protein ACQER4_08970 [Bacteroidota bacterium]